MSISNIVNLKNTRSGNIEVGEITRSQPRAYSARCVLCNVTFTLAHSALRLRQDSNVRLECPNAACRLGILKNEEQDKEYFRQLRANERQVEIEAFDQRMKLKYGSQVTP